MNKPNSGAKIEQKRSSKWLTFIIFSLAFMFAYAAEEALSDDFLDYLTDYSTTQGDVLDPLDLMVLEAKQAEQEKTESDAAPAQEITK